MSKNNKTEKSRTNIEWPESHFTIEDIQAKYPTAVNITLRFRVKKAEEAKDIVLIGKIKPAIGRPRKVYTKANPSNEVLANAAAAGVISTESLKATVAVGDVNAAFDKPSVEVVTDSTESRVTNQATA
jgi:hypothetical protein